PHKKLRITALSFSELRSAPPIWLTSESLRALTIRARSARILEAVRYGLLVVSPIVGLWRSWERASMAWKRSSVRSRPGPPQSLNIGCPRIRINLSELPHTVIVFHHASVAR